MLGIVNRKAAMGATKIQIAANFKLASKKYLHPNRAERLFQSTSNACPRILQIEQRKKHTDKVRAADFDHPRLACDTETSMRQPMGFVEVSSETRS